MYYKSSKCFTLVEKQSQLNTKKIIKTLLKGTYFPNSEIVLETLSNLKLSLLFNRNVPLGYRLFLGVSSDRQAKNEFRLLALFLFTYTSGAAWCSIGYFTSSHF